MSKLAFASSLLILQRPTLALPSSTQIGGYASHESRNTVKTVTPHNLKRFLSRLSGMFSYTKALLQATFQGPRRAYRRTLSDLKPEPLLRRGMTTSGATNGGAPAISGVMIAIIVLIVVFSLLFCGVIACIFRHRKKVIARNGGVNPYRPQFGMGYGARNRHRYGPANTGMGGGYEMGAPPPAYHEATNRYGNDGSRWGGAGYGGGWGNDGSSGWNTGGGGGGYDGGSSGFASSSGGGISSSGHGGGSSSHD